MPTYQIESPSGSSTRPYPQVHPVPGQVYQVTKSFVTLAGFRYFEGEPRSYGEVCLVYGTDSIVDSGVIEYRGWDIHDSWVVARGKDRQHFYFGTGGHGQGYTHHIPKRKLLLC